MKRIALFCILALLLCTALPAWAWEVSPEYAAMAAQLLPDWELLDGCAAGEGDVLLLLSPAGETHLGFLSGDAIALSTALPPHLFLIADACLHGDTAVLLMEDYEGTAYFVGCVLRQEGWQATVSTALPAGTELLTDTYQPAERASLRWTSTVPGIGGTQKLSCTVTVTLQADGRWLVTLVQGWNYGGHVVFRDGFVRDNRRCVHGELLISTDVTQVQWLALPTRVEDAAELMDVTGRAILAEPSALLDAPGGAPLWQYNPGTHLLILGHEDGWVHVAPGGGALSGWMAAEDMLIGSRQLEAEYLAPDDCPVRNRYCNELDVYMLPSEDASNPLLTHLDYRDAFPVYEMGVGPDGAWTQIYSPAIPGGVGFVRTEQLNAEPEWGLG